MHVKLPDIRITTKKSTHRPHSPDSSGVSWRTVDSYYGCVTATLSVAPSVSSCNTYLHQYHYASQGLTHPFISTPYHILAAPVTREALEDVERWSNPGPQDPDPPPLPARQSRPGSRSELASRTICVAPSSSSSSSFSTPTTTPPPHSPRPLLAKTSLAFSTDSFDRPNSSVTSNNGAGLYQQHVQVAMPPPSAFELLEHLQPQPGEGLLLLISEYCGDGTLEELISRGGLRVAGPSAAGAARASSLLLSSSSNLLVVWESLLLLGQVTHGD